MPHRFLNSDEVAEYLNLPQNEIQKMVLQGEIPFRKKGNKPIFRKVDIDAWASQRLLGQNHRSLNAFHRASSGKAHDLSARHAIMPELLKENGIDCRLEARTKSSVIRDMVKLADRTGLLLDIDGLNESILEREKMCTTALSGGVALLHPRHHDPYMFEDSFIVLGKTIQPIPFGSPDGNTTSMFFLVACQADDIHLHVLARLCMMCYHTSMLIELRDSDDADWSYHRILQAEEEVIKEKLSK